MTELPLMLKPTADPATFKETMMSEHTPGPWIVAHSGKSYKVGTPWPDDGTGVAPHAIGLVTADVIGDSRVCEANARLIARSPAMYEVCSLLDSLDCCAGYSLPEADYPKLWDAIEKARAVLATISGPEDPQ